MRTNATIEAPARKMPQAVWVACLLLCATHARADAPLPPPEKVTACSTSGAFCAESDPVGKRTAFVERASGKTRWTIPGWHRWMFVADDGVSLVVGYDGMNLVPLNIEMTAPVLSFYRRGVLIRRVALATLYPSKSAMRRTVSHYAWVQTLGFDRANRFVLHLVDGREIVFDPTTGRPIARRGKP